MGDSDPLATFTHVAREADRRRLAFLCVREHAGPGRIGPRLKEVFHGVYIANERFSRAGAERAIAAGEADAIAFGKLFLANPDLPRRFAERAPLNEPDPSTFYTPGAHGYTDYPGLPVISRVLRGENV